MISISYRDIKAIGVYLSKMFPWFQSLITEEGTDKVMTKRVSHFGLVARSCGRDLEYNACMYL